MNKLRILIIPVTAVSLLASCGSKNTTYHIVNFDTDGGSFVESQKVEDGKTAMKPTKTPTREPTQEKTYTFTGEWLLNNEPFDFDNTPITGDVTLKADYDIKPRQYTVTFDPKDKGTIGSGSTIKVNYGDKFSTINTPEVTITDPGQYSCIGWALTKTGEIPLSSENDYTIQGDITVYAIYTPVVPAYVKFSGYSENCNLCYNGKELSPGDTGSFTIPAGMDVTLTIKPTTGHLPVFKDGLTVTAPESLKRFTPNEQKVIVNVAEGSTCTIKAISEAHKEKLDDYTWSQISQISEMGLADELFTIYSPLDEKLCTKRVQLTHQDTASDGTDKITEGEPYQTVRIIGFDHDVDKDGNPIGITFEFKDLISDKNGYSLAAQWNDTSATTTSNHNYLTTSIRKVLNDPGKVSYWAKKGGITWSTEYDDSVINMLPSELTADGVLKAPKKYVACYNNDLGVWEDKTIDTIGVYDKLFLLSPREMGKENDHQESKEHTSPYAYYENSATSEVICVKKQVKGNEECTITSTIDSEQGQAYRGNVANYAGYNMKSGTSGGGFYWLRSPFTSDDDKAWYVYYNGNISTANGFAYATAGAIAPAFCI
ncbi:MAG: InlB B-repeat-containing protein [Bacilli bacterium]|nr:InlB B-repeat-containing protein [Bacilli bacterium]